MQRSKDLWGCDAHEFRPDRWLDANDTARYNSNFKFVPFNAGSRIVRLSSLRPSVLLQRRLACH
jgi:hypothetical protein